MNKMDESIKMGRNFYKQMSYRKMNVAKTSMMSGYSKLFITFWFCYYYYYF